MQAKDQMPIPNHTKIQWRKYLIGLCFVALGCEGSKPEIQPKRELGRLTDANAIEAVKQFCGDCHPLPAPDSFPRSKWPAEVERGYRFYYDSKRTDLIEPIVSDAIRYFQGDSTEKLLIPSARKSLSFRRGCSSLRAH